MATTKKHTKRKRRLGRVRSTESVAERDEGPSGAISGLRSGFRGLVGGGGGTKKKESPLSKVLTYLLLAAAIGALIYRFTR